MISRSDSAWGSSVDSRGGKILFPVEEWENKGQGWRLHLQNLVPEAIYGLFVRYIRFLPIATENPRCFCNLKDFRLVFWRKCAILHLVLPESKSASSG